MEKSKIVSSSLEENNKFEDKIAFMGVKTPYSYENREEVFYVKVQVTKARIDSLFDLGMQENLIVASLISELGLEISAHSKSYWCTSDANKMQVTQQHHIKFRINVKYEDDAIVDIVPFIIGCLVLRNLYLFDHDVIYYQKANHYQVTKGGKDFI